MNLPLTLYALAGGGLFLLVLPLFLVYVLVSGKHRDSLPNRLGHYPGIRPRRSPAPRVWLHAASVGEVAAATAIITELTVDLPLADIILSTTTPAGQAAARRISGEGVTCIYAPVDFRPAAALALRRVKPDILALVETEIWPNWLHLARRAGIRTVMVNGRISVRSAGGYRHIRSLVGPVLAGMDAFSMIGAADARRLESLGVPSGKIAVNGNAKYDRLAGAANPAAHGAMQKRYNLDKDVPVLVGGSLRGGEGRLLLETFQALRRRLPELVCILAPRHMPRAAQIAQQAADLGIDFQMRSELSAEGAKRQAPLVILDTLGELQATYSVATVVFCGGSLVPQGGQNILEAAAWGKPVLFGPSMEDFQSERNLLLNAGGGREVADQQALVEQVRYYLEQPREAAKAGRAGQAMVRANTGAARKHADVILRVLAC